MIFFIYLNIVTNLYITGDIFTRDIGNTIEQIVLWCVCMWVVGHQINEQNKIAKNLNK